MSHQLIVVRHAKAEPDADSDWERPLSERGREQSTGLGVVLRELVSGPVRALVSSAARTRETWELAAASLESERVLADHLDTLYHADADDLLSAMRGVPDDAETLIVVGHNPAIANLAWALAEGGEPDATDVLRTQGYRPGTATVFVIDGDWSTLEPADATLGRYLPPSA